MALIDSNKFITHLVWSGLVDKATCGELKKIIELCTVKGTYTKADIVVMLEELDFRLTNYKDTDLIRQDIQQKINKLKGEENDI